MTWVVYWRVTSSRSGQRAGPPPRLSRQVRRPGSNQRPSGRQRSASRCGRPQRSQAPPAWLAVHDDGGPAPDRARARRQSRVPRPPRRVRRAPGRRNAVRAPRENPDQRNPGRIDTRMGPKEMQGCVKVRDTGEERRLTGETLDTARAEAVDDERRHPTRDEPVGPGEVTVLEGAEPCLACARPDSKCSSSRERHKERQA